MDPGLARLRRRTARQVAVAAEMPVGPNLIATLIRLRAEPMAADTAVDVHALWDKVISWASAQQMITTHDALTGVRGHLDLPAEEAAMLAAQEIACATHSPYATAAAHVALVDRVSECLPCSWTALDRGDLSPAHVKAINKTTRNCPARVAQAVDEQIVPLAIERGWTPSETAKAARKLVIALDPDGAKDRAAAAKDDADVQLYPGDDETSTLNAHGEAVKARQMMDVINDQAEAMARAGDDRNVGVRRFDALYDLVLGARNSVKSLPQIETQLRLDLTTYLGLNDHPGELVGYGPITADTARAIAADSMLRRLVFDPLTGDTLDLGLKSYRPSAALRRLIEATHPSCGMPGCSRPSIDCEIDHRDERHNGGRTDRCNLGPLCKMHHQMKTKKRWRVDVNPDGSETWTSYLGHTYTKKPRYFPLPEPLEPGPPAEIADQLPVTLFDADPPYPDEPLPTPPPLTDEEYDAMDRAIDDLGLLGMTFRQWCDRYYDEAREVGLVA